MTKTGEVTTNSFSDFDSTKKAEYYDEDGFAIADSQHKDKLKKPLKIENKPCPDLEG
jgi:hypothetical protein